MRCRLSSLPPETPPADDEDHDDQVGGNAQAGEEEDDAGGCLRLLLALDDSSVGLVAAASQVGGKDAGAGDAAAHRVHPTGRRRPARHFSPCCCSLNYGWILVKDLRRRRRVVLRLAGVGLIRFY